jgi:hypothetical protein
MVAQIIGTDRPHQPHFAGSTGAGCLDGPQRQALSLAVLAGSAPVTDMARRHGVSRQFCYRQAGKARDALDEAFAPTRDDPKVLFELPVTKPWLEQLVLALVLIGRSSYRGVIEILDAVFDYSQISLGTIHHIVTQAMDQARTINDAQDLSTIRVGAHDEIFQAGRPVLVGADVDSTYCYLLNVEAHRDETTWGVRLLELRERGLDPSYTIADGGRGLRAGQAAAWPNTPCHGDVFHAERELGRLAFYLENRAKSCAGARDKLEAKMRRSKKRGRGQTLSKRLALARQAEAKAVRLAEDVRTLTDWMQQDILSLAGPDLCTRRELFDFVTEQLHQCEPWCPHRIGPVRRTLENQRDHLLAFAGVLEEQLHDIAVRFNVPRCLVQRVCELQGVNQNKAAHWQRREALHQQLGHRLHDLEAAVKQAMADTPRASSIVENLNSRLRHYFFLRRHLGDDYLHLLRFFLNHRCYLRSDRPERVGRSPAQLLTGQPHRHWLELLGYQRFTRN